MHQAYLPQAMRRHKAAALRKKAARIEAAKEKAQPAEEVLEDDEEEALKGDAVPRSLAEARHQRRSAKQQRRVKPTAYGAAAAATTAAHHVHVDVFKQRRRCKKRAMQPAPPPPPPQQQQQQQPPRPQQDVKNASCWRVKECKTCGVTRNRDKRVRQHVAACARLVRHGRCRGAATAPAVEAAGQRDVSVAPPPQLRWRQRGGGHAVGSGSGSAETPRAAARCKNLCNARQATREKTQNSSSAGRKSCQSELGAGQCF
jgi:hypothetical protein